MIVGEIAAGVVIGKSGFDWIDPSDTLLTGLAAIGFALLMFVVGTHLPVRDRQLRSALAVGAALAATVGAARGVCRGTARRLRRARSPGDPRSAAGDEFRCGRPAAAAECGQVRSRRAGGDRVDRDRRCRNRHRVAGGPRHGTARGAFVLGGVLVVIAGAVLFVLAERGAAAESWVRRLRALSARSGMGPRSAGLVARAVHVRVACQPVRHLDPHRRIRGRRVVALLGEPRRVALQLVGIGEGFAIPLFFVHLGAQIDVGALLSSPQALALAGMLAVAAIAIHVAAALVWRLPIAMGLLASAQLGVPAAVVSIGLATKQLTAAQGAAVMAAVAGDVGSVRWGRRLARSGSDR